MKQSDTDYIAMMKHVSCSSYEIWRG